MKKHALVIATLASILALVSTTSPVLAATDTSGNKQTTVGAIEYSGNNLTIQLTDGINYLATTNASPCSSSYSQSLDTIKIWSSMAQAALLSGKMLNVYFTQCAANGIHYVTVLDLDP
jgi:hypothetical protein